MGWEQPQDSGGQKDLSVSASVGNTLSFARPVSWCVCNVIFSTKVTLP